MHLWIPILYRNPQESLQITAYLNPYRIPTDHCMFESLQNPYRSLHLWMSTEYLQISSIFECLQNTYRYPASLNVYRMPTDIQHLWMSTEYLQISSILESLQNPSLNRKCTESFRLIKKVKMIKKPNIFKFESLKSLESSNPYRIPTDLLNLLILTESLHVCCIFEFLPNPYRSLHLWILIEFLQTSWIFESLENPYRSLESLNPYRIPTDLLNLWIITESLKSS